jgi:hypothetical protein
MRCALSRRAIAVLVMTPIALPIGAATRDTAATAMERFLARPAIAHQYSASRRLEASGSGQRGWLDAQTEFTPASGLNYEVTAEGGSGYIRSRVLRSLLDEEQELIARGRSAAVAISHENYEFTPERITDEGLASVVIRPRRKDRSLIAGRMFLTMEGDLVRVEGKLARNPSFWVTRASIVRSYQRISGVLMPVSLDTNAQLRLLGSSALRMTYRYSRVDGREVSDADVGAFEPWRPPGPSRRSVQRAGPRPSP